MSYEHDKVKSGYAPDPLFVVLVTGLLVGVTALWAANMWWEVPKQTLIDYRTSTQALERENQHLRTELHQAQNNNSDLSKQLETAQNVQN